MQVQLGDPGGGGRQERPVVADQHDALAGSGQEGLQAVEPVEVEVVGGLVEQQHVEAGEQDRGQPGLDPLAAGEPGHRLPQDSGAQADLGEHPRHPGVVVLATEGQEAGQGVVVGLQLGRLGPVPHGGQRLLQGHLGHRQAGATFQVGGGGLPFERVGLLGEVADVQPRRGALDRARGGRLQAGQRPQQGRLAGPVAAEHADPAVAVDHQVDGVEHQLGATDDGEFTCGEHALRVTRRGSRPQPGFRPWSWRAGRHGG